MTAKSLLGLAFAAGLAVATSAAAQTLPDGVVELSLEEMAELAGGDGGETVVITITEQDLNATNFGNSVIADVIGSGDVSLAAGAFSGYSGLGNFVINTGHNNNLQSSMSVNVTLPPAGSTP